MAYTVNLSDRAQFERDFAPSTLWAAYLNDEELRRAWPVLHETPQEVLVRHGSGAVGVLRRQGDRIVSARLEEGPAARALLARHGFRPKDETRARVSRHLVRGAPMEAALNAAFPRRLGVIPLLGGDSSLALFRVGEEGVLAIQLNAAKQVLSASWRVGAEALDALEAHEEAAQWVAPPFPQQDLPVRTPAEAALFVQVQGGTVLLQRSIDAQLQILARTPEGRRLFTFRPQRLSDLGPTDMGSGHSQVLDPVELMLFATRVRDSQTQRPQTDAYARLRLAAAAAREAQRFVPPGARAPSPEQLKSTTARLFLEKNPERLSPEALGRLAEELDGMASLVGAQDTPLQARNLREARWSLRAQGLSPDLVIELGQQWRLPRPGGTEQVFVLDVQPQGPAALGPEALLDLSRAIAAGVPAHPEVLGPDLAEHAAGEMEEALACLAAARAGGARLRTELLERSFAEALAVLRRKKSAPARPSPTPLPPLRPEHARTLLTELSLGRPLEEALTAASARAPLRCTPLLALPQAESHAHQLLLVQEANTEGLGMISAVVDGAGRILGRALLNGEPARAQHSLLEQASFGESLAQHRAQGALETLTRLLTPVLSAAGRGDPEALRSLLPRPGDAARAFSPEVAGQVDAAMKAWLASADPPRIQAGPGRTELRIHAAPVGALATGHALAGPFPRAYRALAERYLVKDRTWVAWVYHAPGQSDGIRYDGLVWLDDHWAWFPKPWRALK